MTTLLLKYAAWFDGGDDIVGFGWGDTRRVSRGAPSLSDSPLYLLRQAVSDQPYHCVGGGQACPTFLALSPICFAGQSAVVDVKGVAFQPRAVAV